MISLFLDLDGTLIDLADTPDAVIIPPPLPQILTTLSQRLNQRLVIATGRRIDTIDRLLAPYKGAAIGSHGAQFRLHADAPIINTLPQRRDALIKTLRDQLPTLLIEDKRYAVAVHFDRDDVFVSTLTQTLNAILMAHQPDWHLMRGRNVIELKPFNANKGVGLHQMMATLLFVNSIPVAIGDDTTDLDLFAAAREHGGLTISVGNRIQGHTDFHLPTPSAAVSLLTACMQYRKDISIAATRELLAAHT